MGADVARTQRWGRRRTGRGGRRLCPAGSGLGGQSHHHRLDRADVRDGQFADRLDDTTFQPQTAQSGPLINLDAFRADPRFADIAGQGYAIVVLDSGLNLTHPFFGDRIVHYQVFTDEGAGAPDGHGHGTNVTSIAASQDATYPGVAPGVNIIHLKVLRDTNSGFFSWMEQALQWVVANAATYNIAAVNMSIGDGGNYNTAQSRYGLGDELAALAALTSSSALRREMGSTR
jgi:subtilisin family serine protease